jgi:elongation factor G
VVVDADTGISYGTQRMMAHAKARGLCRVIVVNKIDHPGAKLGALLDSLRETFGKECLPLNLPDAAHAVVDCFFNRERPQRLRQPSRLRTARWSSRWWRWTAPSSTAT